MRRPEKSRPASVTRRAAVSSRSIGLGIAAAVTAMFLAGAVAAVLTGDAGSPPTDGSTGCLVDRRPPATTLVLLDGSDAFSNVQRDQAARAASNAAQLLPSHGRIMIVGMNADRPEDPIVGFARCVPLNAGLSSIEHGAIYQRRVYQDRIEGPMRVAVDDFVKAARSTASPVAETISAVSRLDGFDPSVPVRTLVIVSDMLQNDTVPVRVRRPGAKSAHMRSLGYSHYSYLDLERSYRSSALAKRFGPDLSGVSVLVIYLERQEAVMFQTAKHRAFWTRYLTEHGAREVRFTNVKGPGA